MDGQKASVVLIWLVITKEFVGENEVIIRIRTRVVKDLYQGGKFLTQVKTEHEPLREN